MARSLPRALLPSRARHALTRAFTLTPKLLAAHAANSVLCLAREGVGASWTLSKERPSYVRERDLVRAESSPSMSPMMSPSAEPAPLLARVRIEGPIEFRGGYHDPCGGYTQGYDTIAESITAAMRDADVLVTFNSPGGVAMGLPECVAEILRVKAETGRRITCVVAGMCGSAAYWIACRIADPGELWITESSKAGSIGARNGHVDISEQLKKDGVAITEFAIPDDKIALSETRPLEEAGRAILETEVREVAAAFFGAVSGARGLSVDDVIALRAHMFTGARAVRKGLCDDVASEKEIEAWAMARAEGKTTMADDEKPDKPGEGEKKEPEENAASAPKHCTECGDTLSSGAKYCAACGSEVKQVMAPDDEDKEPMSEKAAALARRHSTMATMLGLAPTASEAAQRTALARVLAQSEAATKQMKSIARLVGAEDIDTAKGKIRAMQGSVNTLRAEQTRRDEKEFIALCVEGVKIGAFARREDALRDVVSDDGKTHTMIRGPLTKSMSLIELRAFVEEKRAIAPTPPAPSGATPKKPAASAANGGSVATADDPRVRAFAARHGMTPEDAARALNNVPFEGRVS